MTVRPALVLIIVAVVCFLIALCMAASWIDGGNVTAWIAAGLASFALAHAV